jgi:hypothetical protein
LLAISVAVALPSGTLLGEAVTLGVIVAPPTVAVGEGVPQNLPATGLANAISSPTSVWITS